MSQSSRNDVWIKFIFVFFISLLSFSVGTFVGKKFSDNQNKISGHTSAVAAEDSEHSSAEHGSTPHEANADGAHVGEAGHGEGVSSGGEHGSPVAHSEGESAKPEGSNNHGASADEPALTDEEVAQFAKEFVTDSEELAREPASEKKGTKSDTAHGGGSPDHKSEKTVSENAVKVNEKSAAATHSPSAHGAEGAMESKMESKTRSTASAPKESAQEIARRFAKLSPERYALQVASYQKKEEAEARVKELNSKGLVAEIKSADVKGVVWHRVVVGQYSSRDEAMKEASEVKAKSQIAQQPIVQKIAP